MKKHMLTLSNKVQKMSSIVTVFVDQQVASHARGVLAIVVERKSTGTIIACSEAGIITYGLGKKVRWNPSDGNKSRSVMMRISWHYHLIY